VSGKSNNKLRALLDSLGAADDRPRIPDFDELLEAVTASSRRRQARSPTNSAHRNDPEQVMRDGRGRLGGRQSAGLGLNAL
jgi:hypothetical protein